MAGRVAWISIAPVKGMRLQPARRVSLGRDGVPGDRAFFLVDEQRSMVSSVRIGPLLEIVPEHDAERGTLALRFPDGSAVAGPVEAGPPEPVSLRGMTVQAGAVAGPFSEAISEHCGQPLRLMARPADRPMVDRGREGAVTLLGTASLERLRRAGERFESRPGVRPFGIARPDPGPIDARRFRMTFGVEGIEAHQEDGWVGRPLRVGQALVRVCGHVGRCVLTTRDPERGVSDLRVMHFLEDYRYDVASEEPLPFGVFASVAEPGAVELGDEVARA